MRHRSILCATDLSPSSDEAVRQAVVMARNHDARLVLFHMVPLYPPLSALPMSEVPAAVQAPPPPVTDPEGERTVAREALTRQLARVGGGVHASFDVAATGHTAFPEILQRAEAINADLIVVASHRSSALERVLLGSTAEKVVRHAHCAVLLARPSPASGKVLVATDLSESSLPVLRMAADEARRRAATLVAVHCLDLPPEMIGLGGGPLVPAPHEHPESHSSLRHAAEKRVAVFLERAQVHASMIVAEGAPAPSIVAAALEVPAELVVLGSTGKAGLKRVILGSVAEAVVRRAPCSVLVYRERPDLTEAQLPDPATEELLMAEGGLGPATA
jgi:nucleotide-binding universal stress UspA family protein